VRNSRLTHYAYIFTFWYHENAFSITQNALIIQLLRAGACIPTGSTAHKPPSPLARSSEFTVDSDSEMTEARAVSEHTEFSEVYESGINVEPENVAPSAATHPVSPRKLRPRGVQRRCRQSRLGPFPSPPPLLLRKQYFPGAGPS